MYAPGHHFFRLRQTGVDVKQHPALIYCRACGGEPESTAYAHLLPRLDFPGRGKWQTGVSSQSENGPFLPVYPLLFHIFRLPVELLNLFLRGVDVGDINISRRSKGVPDHPAPVVYPFITVLSVGADGVCLYNSLATSCVVYPAQRIYRAMAASSRDSSIFSGRLCYSLWLFHLHSAMKIQPFFRFSPWRDPRLRHFSGYPFGVSRKKASTIFYNTAFRKMLFDHFPISCIRGNQPTLGNSRCLAFTPGQSVCGNARYAQDTGYAYQASA